MSLEQAINRLAVAIENMGSSTTQPDAPEPETVTSAAAPPAEAPPPATLPPVGKVTTGSPLDGLPGIPEFINQDQKRAWLIQELTSRGFEIQPRTKTLTLEKKYAELAVVTPAEPPPETAAETEDDFLSAGPAPPDATVTKNDVTVALQQYVAGAKDEKDKTARIAKAKGILKDNGAEPATVADLPPANYANVINTVRG